MNDLQIKQPKCCRYLLLNRLITRQFELYRIIHQISKYCFASKSSILSLATIALFTWGRLREVNDICNRLDFIASNITFGFNFLLESLYAICSMYLSQRKLRILAKIDYICCVRFPSGTALPGEVSKGFRSDHPTSYCDLKYQQTSFAGWL